VMNSREFIRDGRLRLDASDRIRTHGPFHTSLRERLPLLATGRMW
jgi:hypothetical protein